jgi:hypothetical protein
VVWTCHPKLQGRLRLEESQFQVSLDKKVCETSSQWKKSRYGGMYLSSNYCRKPKIGGWQSRPAWAKEQDSIFKITRAKRAAGMVQV